MGKKDKRVDAYIAKAPEYAKPILTHIRAVVHEACPEVEETIKWSTPSFMYRDSPLGMMAAFKAHCAIRFWNEKLVMGNAATADGNGALSRLTSLSDLPSKKVLGGYVKKAMELKEQGVKPPKAHRDPNFIVWQRSFRISTFASRSCPAMMRSTVSTPRVEPMRQGVHLPHDSSAQNSIA